MPKQYDPIVLDEVMYWFDILQNNSLDGISEVSGIDRNKVQQVLDAKFDKVKLLKEELCRS